MQDPAPKTVRETEHREEVSEMKSLALLAALLVLFAFLAGCTQPVDDTGEDGLKEETVLTEQEQNQELDNFESSLISEDDEMEIGDIV